MRAQTCGSLLLRCAVLAGLPRNPDVSLLSASADEYRQGRHRRFGSTNPEEMTEPFWHDMVLSGLTGYQGADHFSKRVARDREPVWCARNASVSRLRLPDGRFRLGRARRFLRSGFLYLQRRLRARARWWLPNLWLPRRCVSADGFDAQQRSSAKRSTHWIVAYQGARQVVSTPVYVIDTQTLRIESLVWRRRCTGMDLPASSRVGFTARDPHFRWQGCNHVQRKGSSYGRTSAPLR